MSTGVLPPLKSPGVGARRKGNKHLPTLPASAFSPPNTGTSDSFPIPPSPSALQPEHIVDAHVISPSGDLAPWTAETGQSIGPRVRAVVLSLHGAQPPKLEQLVHDVAAAASSTPVLAIAVPFKLDDGPPETPPAYLAAGRAATPTIALTAAFTRPSPAAVDALAWALAQGFVVNIDVQSDLHEDGGWEALEDLLTKATASAGTKGKIILSNILPPPDDLTLPIVKLLTHATYRSYQSHTASLSLFANLYVNILPPAWGAPTPKTPAPAAANLSEEGREAEADKAALASVRETNEWKRRIKMYIGHAIEAFGFQRLLFGSSPAALLAGRSPASNAGDWFELARESFAELGIEQDAIDAIFGLNARLVYAPAPAADEGEEEGEGEGARS